MQNSVSLFQGHSSRLHRWYWVNIFTFPGHPLLHPGVPEALGLQDHPVTPLCSSRSQMGWMLGWANTTLVLGLCNCRVGQPASSSPSSPPEGALQRCPYYFTPCINEQCLEAVLLVWSPQGQFIYTCIFRSSSAVLPRWGVEATLLSTAADEGHGISNYSDFRASSSTWIRSWWVFGGAFSCHPCLHMKMINGGHSLIHATLGLDHPHLSQ